MKYLDNETGINVIGRMLFRFLHVIYFANDIINLANTGFQRP